MNKKSISKTKINMQVVCKFATLSLVVVFMAGWFGAAIMAAAPATPTEKNQLKRMHDRLIGVPPTEADLLSMEAALSSGGPFAAAMDAIESSSRKKEFYNTTLKNFFVKYTNLENSPLEPLNDAAATMVGMVRDNISFDEVLYGNNLYSWPGLQDSQNQATPYSRINNDHYQVLENERYDLSNETGFTNTGQSSTNPVLSITGTPTPAGVLTTRAWGEAYYSDGTNRRILQFTVNKFMCRKLEELKDNTRVPDRVRQDVSRSPGGDSSIFLNHCLACHAGMDPLIAAFAYYDWAEATAGAGFGLVYNNQIKHDLSVTPSVKHKYLINAGSFPQGYVTIDDGWENYWREGKNAELGWGEVTLSTAGATIPPVSAADGSGKTNSGSGPTSYGREFASSNAFAECQVTKVYRHVCLQEPTTEHQVDQADGRLGLDSIVNNFKSGFKMKQVFAETAALCMGQ